MSGKVEIEGLNNLSIINNISNHEEYICIYQKEIFIGQIGKHNALITIVDSMEKHVLPIMRTLIKLRFQSLTEEQELSM